MGIFDTMDDEVRIDNSRNDDKPGRYLQRIDSITLPLTTKKKEEYVRIAKTTVEVLEDFDGVAQEPGTETTQALFRDEYNYLEKDMKAIAACLFGLDPTQASNLKFPEIKRRLVDNKEAAGMLVEVLVTVGGVNAKGKPWVKHTWVRNVTLEEAKTTAEVAQEQAEAWAEAGLED